MVGYDLSPSITSRDGTFLFLSAHPSTYTYDTVLILIRNYLITSEVLSSTITYSPPLKLLDLADYYRSYVALKICLRITPISLDLSRNDPSFSFRIYADILSILHISILYIYYSYYI